jgi:hypothetical protein
VLPTKAPDLRTYTQARASADSAPATRGRLALVVSPSLALQQRVRQLLRAQGHAVVGVLDADAARATVRQATPHVVIADVAADLPSLLPHLASSTAVIEVTGSSPASEIATQVLRLLSPPMRS